jgi:hypothetical protein
MAVEVVEEVGGALERKRLLSSPRLIDVALPVRQVVLAVIRGPALSEHIVELAVTLPPPRELRETGFKLKHRPHRRFIGRELMFAPAADGIVA